MVLSCLSSAWTLFFICVSCESASRASSAARSPTSFRVSLFFVRVKRVTPSSCSSRCIVRVTDGCEMENCSATAERLPASEKQTSCSRSIVSIRSLRIQYIIFVFSMQVLNSSMQN